MQPVPVAGACKEFLCVALCCNMFAADYIKGMLGLLQAILSNLSDSLNCSFVREHMLTSAYLGCYEGIDRSWNVGMLTRITLSMRQFNPPLFI